MARAFNPFLAALEDEQRRYKSEKSGTTNIPKTGKAFNPFTAAMEAEIESKKKREEEEEERLYNEVYNAPPEEEDNQKERGRNFLSRAFDQINIFDGGRSWGQERGDDSKSSFEQGVDFGSNIFEGVTQGVNTVGEGGRLVGELAKIASARATGNEEAESEAIRRATSDEESFLEEGRGIGGKGGWISREESADMSAGDLVKDIAGASLKTGSEVIPIGRASRALTLAKPGQMAKNTAKVAGEGLATGVGYTVGEGLLEDDLDPKTIATGGIIGVSLGGIMGNIGSRIATRKANTLARNAAQEAADKAAIRKQGEDVVQSMMQPQRTLLLGDGSENISRRIKDLDDELASLGEGSTFKPTDGAGVETRTLRDTQSIIEETGETVGSPTGPQKVLDEFVIDGGEGTTTVTPGTFENNAQRIKEIKRERATLQNELESIKVQKEVQPDYNPKTTETVIQKAAKSAETAKQVNDNMKFTDYKGRITDNLSSFFKALEGKLESTGGGRLTTNYYQKVIGGIASRNETQKVFARNLNANMESVVGKLSNRMKRKMGVEVGETLRRVADEDMAELTVSQISSKYGIDAKNVQVAKVLRQHFKDLLEETNKVRVERGQEAIPYRAEYMPQWSKNKITDGAGRGASMADEKFNPFAQSRTKNNQDFEKNVFKTLDQYHRYASNELHLTPVVRDLRKTSAQLKEAGNENASAFLDDFIDTAILKNRTAGWDKAWGIKEGSKRQAALQRISMARSLSGLAGNLRWMLVTQPQSLAVTVGKFGPINTAKGMLDYVTDSAVRKEIKNLPMYRLKRSQSVGATAGGQLDRVSDSVLKSRREFANDVMGMPANFIEETLDGMSAAAARRNALGHMKSGKMTKEGMKNFMQHGIEVTQSVYSAEARPMVLQNLMARSAFPFQTYSVEMWRHLNNLGRGKGAGWNQTGVDRARQATVMVSAIILGNELQKQVTGSDIATPGSVVPFVGTQVNQGIDWATAMFGEGTEFASGGGAGLTSFERDLGDFAGIAGDLSDSFQGDGDLPVGFSEGLEDYLNTGKADKFRKVLTRWGMGLAGVGGASTVNRMMDMAIDYNNEAIKTAKGRDIPFERTAGNVLTSGLMGRGALPQTEEFYGPQGGNQFTEKEWDMVNIVPEEQRDAYSAFFGSTKDDPAKKTITAKKIRQAVEDRNLEKARRLAAQYNRSMADKIGMLESEVGKIDKIMLDYLSTYMIDFDYYKRQYDKK